MFDKDYDSRVSQLGVTGEILHCHNRRGSYCPLVGRNKQILEKKRCKGSTTEWKTTEEKASILER